MNKLPLDLFRCIKERKFSPAVRSVWVLLLLTAAAGAAYFNALNHPFMMDDGTLIFGDPLRHHPARIFNHFLPSYEHGLSGVRDQTQGAKYFRPWAHVLPLLSYAVFGSQVFFYHLLNLFLLIAAAFLFYFFLRMLFGDEVPAALAAGLFAVHPLNGMLVNYVTAGALSLMLIFSIAGLMCLIFSCRRSRPYGLVMIFGVVMYVNAMLCHEAAIALPLLAVPVLWGARQGIRNIFPALLPYILTGVGYFAFRMTYASLKSSLFDKMGLLQSSPADYAAAFSKLVVWYFKALAFLQDIVLIKSEEVAGGRAGWWLLILAVLICSGCLIFRFCENRPARFGLLFFAAGFLPVTLACFFQDSAGLIFEPHWMLVSSLGFFTASAVFFDAYGRVMGPVWRTLIIALVMGLCILKSWDYNRIWAEQKNYSEYWAGVSPSLDLPQFFLGDVYVVQHKWSEAKAAYLEAARKSRRPFDYYYNLAGILILEGGDLQLAKDYLLRAMAIDPASSRARVSLGMIYSVLDGRDDIAERLFKEAAYYNPRSTEARKRLAELYIGQEKFLKAAEQYEKILADDPDNPGMPGKIISLYLQAGDQAAVAAAAERLLAYLDDPRHLLDAAVLLAQADYQISAEHYFEKALVKGPDLQEVYAEAGKFLGNIGDYDGAVVIWREGLKRHPDDAALMSLVKQAGFLKGQ